VKNQRSIQFLSGLSAAQAGDQSGSRRTVTLPARMLVTSEWGDAVCSKPCDTFVTPRLLNGESILYWVHKQ